MSKKQPKLTQWFPASVKPARAGAYLLGFKRLSGEVTQMAFPYHWFDGEKWVANAACAPRRLDGDLYPLDAIYRKDAYWRGLAEQPKGARRA